MSAGSPLRRRRLLRLAALASAGGVFPPAIQRALALPAARRRGTIDDVEHVVILTQENRAFDHYFGTLRGVRGFDDRFPIPLPDGRPVWRQRDAAGREITPYRLDTARTSAQRIAGTPHTWRDAQEAWNEGRMDRWLPAKTERTMGHYAQADLAFHFALADAFTICDAYHCSFQGGTNPNRLFLWTGTNDPAGQGGGPAIVNSFDDLGPADEGYRWTTYPERLERAGVSWAHYQDMADNFTDNPVEGFRAYRAAQPGSALHAKALTTQGLDRFARDAREGRLPQVSWLIAPARQCEHPDPSSPLQGAAYIAAVLDTLTADPQVWARTVLFVNYDENDGFFDHVPPPAPPSRDAQGRLHGGSTVALDGEYHDARGGPSHGSDDDPPQLHGRPYGLGPRVPMFVVSPWSRGGWVNSEVFDHSSVLRFLERRFGVAEPQISPWRRAVCGDLSSAFDFARPDGRAMPRWPRVRGVDAEVARQSLLPAPMPPALRRMPHQQRGVRPSRALPYAVDVTQTWAAGGEQLRLGLHNAGAAALVLHVHDRLDPERPPRRFTIEPGRQLDGEWPLRPGIGPAWHLQLHGPNGFFRAWRGVHADGLQLATRADRRGAIVLLIDSPSARSLTLRDHYGLQPARTLAIMPGRTEWCIDLTHQRCWYDLELTAPDDPHWLCRAAGRVETGRDGMSDIGLSAPPPRSET